MLISSSSLGCLVASMMTLYVVAWTSWMFSHERGYSSSILTWKNCVGCFCYVLRRLDPWFLCRGESGGGRVVGRMMIGDGMISAICGLHWCLIVIVAVVCSVWIAGGDVSFTGPGCQHAGVPLVVVVCLVAAVGWRGYSPAESAGCLLLSAPFL